MRKKTPLIIQFRQMEDTEVSVVIWTVTEPEGREERSGQHTAGWGHCSGL